MHDVMRSWRQATTTLVARAGVRARVVLSAGFLALSATPALAQFDLEPTEFVFDAPAAEIPPSAELDNLFARAADATAQGDWKLAIDCLQRVMDDPVGGLVEVGGSNAPLVRYESARRRALRELGTLPPDGLAAYRLLHDGRARRLIDTARASGDPAPLREIVERYLLTSYGDDACDLLSSWALDEGRPREAVMALSSLREFVPEYREGPGPRDGIPPQRLAAKLACARVMLGQPAEARRLAERAAPADAWMAQLAELGPAESADAAQTGGWLLSGGTTDRSGEMAAIAPTMQEMALWQVPFAGVRADLWQSDTPRRLLDPDDLPVAAPLWYDGRVYARTLDGVVAVDAESMSVAWAQRTRPEGDEAIAAASPAGGYSVDAAQIEWDRLFTDHVTGAMTIAHGRVFLVEMGTGRWQTQINLLRPAWRGGLDAEWSTTHAELIALDATTGEVAWRRSAREAAGEALGSVQFCAAPLAIGPHLWVPMMRGTDFLLAVFDPADGSLVREVDLGWFADENVQTAAALDLAAVEGLVIVPSGQGVLYAVDAVDFTPRWAVRYAERVGRRLGGGSGEGWLSSPPVICGDRVLLAPAGQEELLAFALADGRPLWSVAKPPGARYVIGAEARRAWLGGTSIACVSMEDGSTLWSHYLSDAPSGRAIRCDDRILAPTVDGLAVMPAVNADSVDRLAVENADQPLGNLLSWDGSLFSLDPRQLRKYPDLATAYPRAVERHAANPKDPRLAMRLAWLELFRREPAAGYRVLAGLDEELFAPDTPGSSDLAHLRVSLLLALADAPDAPADEVMARIEEAQRFARRSTDRLRVGVRSGRELARRGRGAEAFEGLLRLAMSSDADRPAAAVDSVVAPERMRLSAELSSVVAGLSPQDAERVRRLLDREVAGWIERLADPSTRGDARMALDRLGHLPATGAGGQRALVALGLAERARQRFEASEYYLTQAAARDAEPELTAAAAMALADLYGDPMQRLDAPRLARIEQLDERFASSPIPGMYAAASPEQAAHDTIGSWIAAARSALDTRAVARERFDETRPSFLLWSQQLWGQAARSGSFGGRLMSFAGPRPAALAERAIFYDEDDVLTCRDVASGAVQWQAELRREREFRALESFDLGNIFGEQVELPGGHRAAADGQIMIVRGDTALHAIGLVTGRRLWVKPFDVPDADPDHEAGDYSLVAYGGHVAATPRSGRLTLMRTLDGETLWEADLQGEPADYVLFGVDRVIILDADHERASLFDRATGRRVARVLFRQPDSDHNVVEVARVSDLLIGPGDQGDSSVKAVDLSTGQVRWELAGDEGSDALLQSILQVGRGVIALGMSGGDVALVSASTGKPVGQLAVGENGDLYDAVVSGETFIGRYVDTESGVNEAALVAHDLGTGRERWRREDLAPIELFEHPLRLYGTSQPTIPILIDVDRSAGRSRRGNFELHLISVRDGATIGEGANLTTAGSGLSYVLDFDVWADALIVVMINDLRAFRVAVGELP